MAQGKFTRPDARYVILAVLWCFSGLFSLEARGGKWQWTPSGGADQAWTVPANWTGSPGYPYLIDNVAVLNNNLAAPQTVNLGASIKLGSLLLGDSAPPYHPLTIGPTGNLYLEVTEGKARIDKTAGGADMIASPITLYDDLVISNKQNDLNFPLRISGAIGGSGRFITIDGAGPDATVEFSYANGYTGGLILNSGRVRATRYTTALGSGSFIMNGGTLELVDNNNTAFMRPTTINSDAAILIDRETDGPWGRFTMGNLSIGNQILSVDTGSHVQSVAGERGWQELVFGTTTLLEDGAIFDVGPETHLTLGALVGNKSVTKRGPGRLDLATAASPRFGTTILEEGTLRLRTAYALGDSGSATAPLQLKGGLLDLMASATTFSGTTVTLDGDATIEAGPASAGAGVLHTLGPLSIGGQKLTIRKGKHVVSGASSTPGTFGVTFGATTLSGGNAIFDIDDAAPTAQSFNPTYPQGRMTPGAIGGPGGLVKTGSGTLYLAGLNTFEGPVTVAEGTFRVHHPAAFGSDAAGTTVTPGGMIDLTYATAATFAEPLSLSGTGVGGQGAINAKANVLHTFSGPVALDGHVRIGSYVNTSASCELRFAGPVTGTNAAFEKVGYAASGVSFAGANTFTGTTTVTSGRLQLYYATQNNSKLDDASNLIMAGGKLDLNGGTHTETVAGTVLKAGESSVTRAATASTLQMNAITREAGSILYIGAASIASTDNANANGILGGWATVGSGWAVNSTGGADAPITALATYKTTGEST